ncbi:hypothetical protein Lepto7376_0899 [[Leptolyngbya] sp. PCC 7376]|uniref:hypothetical protein n=1 Tax=[Leptolyngbya] sp. PCC 7376 TaxID=111781 RepID=UPI00029EC588|nr:hypothetical protein [[Leptolyngbya] sp. PCC 7376]AFY37277.1 hypothetical protein Lepto7376_0899 [[Leptolyngbya] sp. PCC 7376]
MSTSFENLRLQVAELGDTKLEALAITVEKELSRRRDDQKLASVNGCYELKGIKSGKKIHYYWYLRYRQNGKLKSKYLGKGLEAETAPSPQLRDKGANHLSEATK